MLVGILNKSTPPVSYLINSAALEKTNYSTVASFINDGLTLLYAPNPVKSENVKAMLSDAAAFMIKAGKALLVFYPELIHFTCMAHALNRLAELVRAEYPSVNNLINNGKKVFLKAPLRVEFYKEMAPGLSLPPEPVITRWGTWLNAALFYADNFVKIKDIFLSLDADSIALRSCKESILGGHLVFIKAHFFMLAKAIMELETTQLSLNDSFRIIEKVIEEISLIPGEIGNKIRVKRESVLSRNPGYQQIKNVCYILRGQNQSDPDIKMKPSDIASLKFAPITSCDVERSFSAFKNVLTNKRHNLSMDSINELLVLYCNPIV
ncbi:unnamed protein product [Acanthoscelides obtectus]|uniref:DUF659 domain-containing protein n=1 Tax=Acanthoscelides obtectus TaxID=200917 RepID=A0A9P0L462_ACAOB|nr:unnamed protein product [Acanthoscelides obtectus]CAK1638551.1 hypothetical protein AOBTE_LOCUS10660 [Acanthoscelides obtectus]